MNISDLKALAERLRDPYANLPPDADKQAAAAIDALILALEEARKVIEPFATTTADGGETYSVADLRAARDWLAKQVTR